MVKMGEAEEEAPKPAHAVWVASEQQVLSYLLLSSSEDVLTLRSHPSHLPSVCGRILRGMFAPQYRVHAINTSMALAIMQKGNSTISEYVAKMRGLTDEMASAGKRLDDEDLVSYILAGLDAEFNLVVSVVAAPVEPILVGKLFSQLSSFEQRMQLLQGPNQSSASSASRGRCGGNQSRGRGRGHNSGRGNGGGRGNYYRSNVNGFSTSGFSLVECQLCGKIGCTILRCYKRFDTSFTGKEKECICSNHLVQDWH